MQPLQNVTDNKDKMQLLGQAQTQTKDQRLEGQEPGLKDRFIDGTIDFGIGGLDAAEDAVSTGFDGFLVDSAIKLGQKHIPKIPGISRIPGAARLAPYLMRSPQAAAIGATAVGSYGLGKAFTEATGLDDKVANMIVGNKDYSGSGNITGEQQKLMDQGFNPYEPTYNEHSRGPQYTDKSASNINGYERSPGYTRWIEMGGTDETYARRNAGYNGREQTPEFKAHVAAGGNEVSFAAQPQGPSGGPTNTNQATPMLDDVMQNGIGPFQPGAIDIGANQPNLAQSAVQAASNPNLEAVKAAGQAPQPNLGAVEQAPPAQIPGVPQHGDLVGSYQDRDGRNVGIFEGMPMRNEQGELTYIGDDQVAAMQDRMDAQGAPVISGEKEGNLVPFIDNMGNVQYGDKQTANGMNAIEAEYQREDKAAHQRFLQSDAAKQMTARSLENARADVAAQNAQSQAREARMNARPDFNEARPGVTNSLDGLTSSQRRRMYPDPADAERSKRGILPDGTSMEADRKAKELKMKETQARIDALKDKDPSKYEANIDVVNGLIQGPQFENLDDAQKARVKTIMMMELMGIGTEETQFEFDGIVYPEPVSPGNGNGDGSSSSASE